MLIRPTSIGGSRKNSVTLFRCYDVLHPGAAPKGADIARPAEFVLDSNGVVRWVNLTDNIAVRARPDQVLETLNQLGSAGQ